MNAPALTKDSPQSQTALSIKSYSKVASIRLKSVQEAFRKDGEEIERRDRDCVIIKMGTYQRVYFYAFGAVVFVNVSTALHAEILAKAGFVPENTGEQSLGTTTLTADDYRIVLGAQNTTVSFSVVELPSWKEEQIGILARIIAQSSALELIEHEVEGLVAASERMTADLRDDAWLTFGRTKLLKFMRQGLEAKHKLVTQLALLRDPEIVWEDEGAYKLYNLLSENFDIWERLSTIESMLELPAEVARLHLDIRHARRSEILEIIIILLIAFEIVQTFVF